MARMSAMGMPVATGEERAAAGPAAARPAMSRRLQATILGLGIVVAVVAESIWAQVPWVTPQLVVLDVLTYGTYIVAGVVAWSRRPANPIGRLLVASGFASFISGFWAFDLPGITTIGNTFQIVGSATLVHALLAYPTGHLRGRFDRAFVAVMYVVWVGIGAIIAVSPSGPDWYGCGTRCDAGPVLTSLDAATVAALGELRERTFQPFALVLLAIMAARWIRGSTVARRIYGPVLLATVGYIIAAAIADALPFFESQTVWYVAQALVPLTMLFGMLRLRLVRGGVGGLVLELRAASRSRGVDAARPGGGAATGAPRSDPAAAPVRR